jgi:hypothetical protein
LHKTIRLYGAHSLGIEARLLLNDSEDEGTISFENSDETKIERSIEMFGVEVAE